MFHGVTNFKSLKIFKIENERSLDPYYIENLSKFDQICKLSLFNSPLIVPLDAMLDRNPNIEYLDMSGDSNILSESIDRLAD